MTVLKTKKNNRGRALPKPGPGRPKGCKNKFTSVKQSFLDAFEATGGTQGLIDWVKENKHNRALFYGWITKMLPSNIDVSGGLSITYQVSDKFLPKPTKPKDAKQK